MVCKRHKLTMALFFVGIALLIIALAGAVLFVTRLPLRKTLTDSIRGKDLAFLMMTPVPTPLPTDTPTMIVTPTRRPKPPTLTPTATLTPVSTLTPTPTPKPTSTPVLPAQASWNPQTPVPPAPPGYKPSEACVVTPCAPPPQLVGPDEGAQLMVNSMVEFKWTWIYCLPPGWKFAIRLSDYKPPHSYQYIDASDWVSCQPDGTSVVHYPMKIDPKTCDRFTTIPGTYYWNVAVTRSTEGGGWERLSEGSEVRRFIVVRGGNGGGNGGCPVPPCDGGGDVPKPTHTPAPTFTDTPAPPNINKTPPCHPPVCSDTPSPLPSLTPVPLPTVMVEVEWPERMEIDRSGYVMVSLVRTAEGEFVPTVETTEHIVIAATSVRVSGTPEAPIEKAFGPMYKAYAIARLEGAAFEIRPLGTEHQSLDQDQITWDWNILPLKPGHQIINVCVIVQWQPTEEKRDIIERTIWRVPLTVVVEQSWIKTDQLSIASLIYGFLGSVFSAPLLYVIIKEAREKRQKEEKSKPKIQIARR